MGLILGLIGLGVAHNMVGTIAETVSGTVSGVSHQRTYRTIESERIRADAAKYIAREETQREIAASQIQWDAMRDIECMRAQAQVITATAGVKSGFYESLFSHQETPILIPTASQAPTATSSCFCSYCGERIDEGIRFCPYCGNQV